MENGGRKTEHNVSSVLPVINKPRNIPKFCSIDYIRYCPFTKASWPNMSIDVINIATCRLVIPEIREILLPSNQEMKWSEEKEKHNLVDRIINLCPLLFPSTSFITSPMYSHTKVPREIASPALTAHPCKQSMLALTDDLADWLLKRMWKVITFFSVLNISSLTWIPFWRTLLWHVASHLHKELHS